MPYQTINVLEQLWNSFEEKIKIISDINSAHLPDIKKLMTAESVIDLSLHEIYFHTEYVHELTDNLMNLKNSHLEDKKASECYQLWLSILKQRNQIPLKIKHHKKLDGECDFRFSLQAMEGNPNRFKEIQVLDSKNKTELNKAIKSITRLDCLAEGVSFAGLPLMHDTIMSRLFEYEDTICLIAKDQSDQIIGHCWGILLRDVAVNQKEKINVFWVMDLARDPDFIDVNNKVGDKLRTKMVDTIKSKNNCEFIGYQHLLNNKFHVNIIRDTQGKDEQIHFYDKEFAGKTATKYNDDLGLFVRSHLIRTSENNHPYPEFEGIRSALYKAIWRAAHSVKDFILGGIVLIGRMQYQKLTHTLLDNPIDQRLVEPVSNEQRSCDIKILKEIILSDKWKQQGKSIFNGRHIPSTLQKLQHLVQSEEFNFQSIKSCIANSGKNLLRSKLTTLFYNIISVANSPTFVLNGLLENNDTPKDWVDLISNTRNATLGMKSTIK